jgi:hypothetical protein
LRTTDVPRRCAEIRVVEAHVVTSSAGGARLVTLLSSLSLFLESTDVQARRYTCRSAAFGTVPVSPLVCTSVPGGRTDRSREPSRAVAKATRSTCEYGWESELPVLAGYLGDHKAKVPRGNQAGRGVAWDHFHLLIPV